MPPVANPYLETQVLTSSPERLHLMIVEAAIRFARQGEAALEAGNIDVAFRALSKSRDCVNEIMTGINGDLNRDLAEQLRGLFVFVQQNLVRADLRRDPQLIRDALVILEHHRQTWLQLLERLLQEAAVLRGPHRKEVTENSWVT
jgi:flagellar protein FliS